MRLYNERTKKKDEIRKNPDGIIRFYVCGPTVYDYAHLGNLRTYIYTDILRRALKLQGHKVTEVMNITDIDDKIIKKASEQGVPYKNVTQKYKKAFLKNIKDLNLEAPEHLPEATDEGIISKIIEVIDGLVDKGFAYKSEDDSIYFSIERFSNYGKLSGVDTSGIQSGARVSQDEYEKENPRDFVVWKARQEGEPFWPAPFGDGRPGWHIECTAMALKYLGKTIDIHAGGVDLIFPHHENEVAQSEAYTGKQFVKHWFHCEFLFVEGEKMSKSLKNIFTLEEIENKYGIEPLAFRLLVIMSHYRERLNFTRDSIIQAQKTLNNLRNFVLNNKEAKIRKGTIKITDYQESFYKAINDDLNTSMALATVFELTRKVNSKKEYSEEIYTLLIEFDHVLGLDLTNISPKKELKEIFEKYLKAKKEKDFSSSDRFRKEIQNLGWTTEDAQDSSRLRLK